MMADETTIHAGSNYLDDPPAEPRGIDTYTA